MKNQLKLAYLHTSSLYLVENSFFLYLVCLANTGVFYANKVLYRANLEEFVKVVFQANIYSGQIQLYLGLIQLYLGEIYWYLGRKQQYL